MKYVPHSYQAHAEEHIIDNPTCGLFLDMGLGKTVIALTAIQRLLFDSLEISKILVVAPKRVAQFTWTAERDKWDHLKGLRLSLVLGSEKERKAALRRKAEVYIINRENLAWLIGYYATAWPFDMVVLDELSSFKAPDSIRFRQFKKVRPFCKRVIGLTGTPSPNSLVDLWAQMYCLDQGQRLGKTITGYRDNYFNPDKRNGSVVYNYKLKNGFTSEQEIYKLIGDICISMKASDYLDMPERISRVISVGMGEDVFNRYRDFEEIQVMEMMNGEEITALNAAALSSKLLQFANGAIYGPEKPDYHIVHDAKLEALDEVIEAANGHPVMVFYWFKHDLERLKERYRKMHPRTLDTDKDVQDWNKGKIPLLFLHPASAGHGLNLQAGGNIIVWFGLTWSLELYQQANARLYRQGQQYAVIIHHLIAGGTIDEDVMQALSRKEKGQDALMSAVKAIVARHTK